MITSVAIAGWSGLRLRSLSQAGYSRQFLPNDEKMMLQRIAEWLSDLLSVMAGGSDRFGFYTVRTRCRAVVRFVSKR